MNDRAKVLKVTAIITSSVTILSLMFCIIFSAIDGFSLYSYFGLLIAIGSCIILWKMYIDEKKHNRKSV